MSRFEALSRIPTERPAATLALAAGIAALAAFALTRVELQVDVSQIIRTPAVQTLAEANASFGFEEQAYLLAEDPTSADEAQAEARLLRFGRRIRERLADAAAIESVGFSLPRVDEAAIDRLLLPWGPLYAEAGALEQRLTRAGMTEQLELQLARLGQQGLGQAERWVERDPFDLHRPIVERLERLAAGRQVDPGSPWALTPDRRGLLITVRCATDGGGVADAKAVVRALEEARVETLAEPWAEGLIASGTGGVYLAEESERVIREDVMRGMSVSLVLALLLLSIGLRLRPWVVLVLMIPTLWGALIGVGAVAAARGSLAILSLGCATTLIGLGLDFTIHVAATARAERARGFGPRESALRAIEQTRGALVGAALTSVAAFLAFQAAQLEFLVDMGRVIAGGLIACLFAALTLVPLLLARVLAREKAEARPPRTLGVDRVVGFATRRPKRVVLGALLLAVGAGAVLSTRPPQLETDLRRLHARDSAPLATQARIVQAFGGTQEPVFLLLSGVDEAAVVAGCHRLEPALRALAEGGPLAGHASVTALLPSLADQSAAQAVLTQRGALRLQRDARASLEAVGFDAGSFDPVIVGLGRAASLERSLTTAELRAIGFGAQLDRFVRPAQADQPARAMILLTPRGTLLTAEERDVLLSALRAAIAESGVERVGLGGLPVVSAESAAVIASDFGRVSFLTLGAVLLVLVIRFRSLPAIALALTPAVLGTLISAAVFALADVRLNMMNLAVLPMVLAIGIDDGIHVVHRHLHGPRGVEAHFHPTSVGVVLTSLTTMVAFGSLALSRNLGLSSVGVLTLFGVGSCLVTSVLVLPALLALVKIGGSEPVDLPEESL